jgi:hypothetical protein
MDTVFGLFTAVQNASYARSATRRLHTPESPSSRSPSTKSLFEILMQTHTPSLAFDHLVDRMSLDDLVVLDDISADAQMCLTGEITSKTVTNDELVGIVDDVVEFFEEVIPQHLVDDAVMALNDEAIVYLDSLGDSTLPSSKEFRRRVLRRLRNSKDSSGVRRKLTFRGSGKGRD